MFFYYLLYFFLAFKSIEETQAFNTFKKQTQNLLIIFFSLFIGLRNQVGCDWDQYLFLFDEIILTSTRDPGDMFSLSSTLEKQSV